MRACFYIILLLLATTVTALAQPDAENYEIMTSQQGLPHNTVLALAQDSYGFLWIGTYNKLCIYDGHSLKKYDHVPDVAGKNSNFRIVDRLFEDRHKNMWAGSWGNWISCYIRGEGKFKVFSKSHSAPGLKLQCIGEDDKGTIWLGCENGDLEYINGDSIYYEYSIHNPVFGVFAAGADSLYMICYDSLLCYNTSTHKAKLITIPGWKASHVASVSMSKDAHRLIVVGENSAIIDLRQRKLIATLNTGSQRPRGRIAYANADGTFTYTDGSVIKKYTHDGMLIDSIAISNNSLYDKNEILNCAIGDRSGILWIGSNSGLMKVDPKHYRFIKYSRGNAVRKLNDNYIRSVLDDSDRMWLGSRQGQISELQKTGNTYTLKRSYPLRYVILERDEQTPYSYTTNTFLRLRNGTVLAGGDKGIYALNKKRGEFETFMPQLASRALTHVWALYEDAKNNIWIGTSFTGITIIERSTGKCIRYPAPDSNLAGSDNIWNIFKDASGTIWLGTNNGIFRVVGDTDINKLSFVKYPLLKRGKEHVWNITEDNQGALWIGTVDDGLFNISPDRKHVEAIAHPELTYACSIQRDRHSNLWIGTMNGLYKYNTVNGSLARFDEQDGLASNDFNFKAATTTADGYMLFCGKQGMTQFYPDSIYKQDVTNAPVQITNVSVNNKSIRSLPGADNVLHLDYKQNQLEIGLAILEFSEPGNHLFRYMLEGFDQRWNYGSADQARARYTNIPPGDYRFIAEGSADGAQWSNSRATMAIHIKPALWQRTGFWVVIAILVVLAVAALVYGRIRILVNRERKARDIEKQMAELELKALQAQMNPHFIFNTINAIQHFIVHKDERVANDYLSRFARLMRMFLDASNNKYVTIEKETAMLDIYLSLEKLRFEDKFDYFIWHDGEDIKKLLIPSMLIQPFAENAIIHGLVHGQRKGLLTIKFQVVSGKETFILCTIEDNGIGRRESSEINAVKKPAHISRGTQLIEERIKTFNFVNEQHIGIHYTDKQPPESGTIVELRIPVNMANVYLTGS